DIWRVEFAQPGAHRPGAEEETLVGEAARQVVRDQDIFSLAKATVENRRGNRGAVDGERAFVGGRIEPAGWRRFRRRLLRHSFSAIPSPSAHNCPIVVGTDSPVNPKRCSTCRDTSMASRLSMPSLANVVSAAFSSGASGRLIFSSMK